MFGDDINLFVSHKNIDTFFGSMNVKLENVSNCFKSDKLSLNARCYFILSLKGSYFHRPCLTFLLKIKREHVKREHVTKLLGIFIHESFSWNNHIDIVSSIVSKSTGTIYKSRDVLSEQCLKQLHFCFIHN